MSQTGKDPIRAVPTNIITGFLGVGKTSAILHLLKSKPANERWAILVNEFGEIGIDGALLEGQSANESGLFIREVPGGCMCCAAGVPMQVALTQLLARARPDRLLIEPTGLGHPTEVLNVLNGEHYRDVIAIHKTITLVDARQLSDSRYTEKDTFLQQLAIADVIVGNKSDLYQQSDHAMLDQFVQQQGLDRVSILTTRQGVIDFTYLEGDTGALSDKHGHTHDDEDHHEDEHEHGHNADHNDDDKGRVDLNSAPLDEIDMSSSPLDGVDLGSTSYPDGCYVQAINRGEGYVSVGWRFSPDLLFSSEKLTAVLSSMDAERIKGVFITDKGTIGYNIAGDSIAQSQMDAYPESRMEIIASQLNEEWGRQLLACVV